MEKNYLEVSELSIWERVFFMPVKFFISPHLKTRLSKIQESQTDEHVKTFGAEISSRHRVRNVEQNRLDII